MAMQQHKDAYQKRLKNALDPDARRNLEHDVLKADECCEVPVERRLADYYKSSDSALLEAVQRLGIELSRSVQRLGSERATSLSNR